MGTLKSILQNFLTDFFSQGKECLLCGAQSGYEHICMLCQKQIACSAMPKCSVCGRYMLDQIQLDYICEECRDERPPFYLARSIGPYSGVLKEAIYAFKYQRKRPLALYFGDLMGGVFLKERAFWETELIIPVPLSENKESQRGFNQSQLLAEELGKFLKIKVINALVRNQDTKKQSQLNRQERIRNMKGIFSTKGSVHGRKIILVDDIYTTGATSTECTRVLLRAGALKVGIITVASGLRQKY